MAIELALTLTDVGKDQWMYTLQYGKVLEEFTLPLPICQMSLKEQHQAILAMLSRVFEQEAENKYNERPRDSPEGSLLHDLLDEMMDDEDEDDEEDDE